MKLVRLTFWFIFLSITCSGVFAIGVYENSDYNYYTNLENPTIEINISAGTNPIQVKEAVLFDNNQEHMYKDGTTYLGRLSQEVFIFDLEQNLSDIIQPRFKLYVYNSYGNRLITPQGDPVDFNIVYDNTTPQLLNLNNQISSNNKLILEFSEPVSDVNVTINDKEYDYNNIEEHHLINTDNTIEIPINDMNAINGLLDIVIEFEDLAGNKNTHEEQIYLSSEDLKINLITKQNDSSLKYNYDFRYEDFFNNTIYSESENFQFKIETNKEAKCYFSSSLFSFKEFNLVDEKQEFSTTDNLTHAIDIDNFDKNVWVACTNSLYSNEVAYLNEEFNNNLIKIKKYNGDSLQIISALPDSLVTNNPFSIFAKTNERAICFYQMDSEEKQFLDTTNYKDFQKLNLDYTGNHDLKFECIDVLNNNVIVTNNIEIDPSIGIKISDYSPKFTMSLPQKIQVVLSEYDNIECAYSKEQIGITPESYNALTKLTGEGIKKNFTISSLESGQNNISIYCNKNGQVSPNVISIIYDDKGIIMENFTFINNDDYKSPTYIGSDQEIEIDFEVQSIIPITEYEVRATIDNETFSKKFSSAPIKIKEDFSNVTDIKIIITNELGVNRTFQKTIQYDSTPPVITFSELSGGRKIICNDGESGCAQVYYGFSQTSIECRANVRYDTLNGTASILDIEGKNYLCSQAFNYAGQRSYEILSTSENLTSGGWRDDNESGINDTDIFDNESSNIGDNLTNTSDDDDIFDDKDPFVDDSDSTPPQDDNTATYLLVAAIILILAGAGGGGYYAYKKGYLDKELKKLGIKVPNRSANKDASKEGSKSQSITNPLKSDTNKDNYKKSSYDSHLKKLNKFIDNKIGKSDDVFSNFEDKNKGRVKGYKDTLLKGNKKNDLSKEDFDEFYSNSSSDKLKNSQSVQKEAESFEKYYKDKHNKDANSSKEDEDKK